jgi:hypothetical protein
MIDVMIVEQSVECELAGEIEVLAEKVTQCHSVHHKSNPRVGVVFFVWWTFERRTAGANKQNSGTSET